MAGPRIVHETLRGPNVIKEIVIAFAIGTTAGMLWKKQQWKGQRDARNFYELLEKNQATVVAAEE